MIDVIETTLQRLGEQLSGRLSFPGDDRYAAATTIWPKPVGDMPCAVAHCCTADDVQSAIRAARDCELPLSVRGGGHDWAGRALCEGLVIDLSPMNTVVVSSDRHTAQISGGARASDVLALTDPLGLAPVTGSVGAVGMTGFTLGGGYGPLIGRFGLGLDNLLAAKVVLADGRIVTASPEREAELFWALRGGGGNFGVVTAMRQRVHNLATVHSGSIVYPFSEAKCVLERCADIATCTPDELTFQIGLLTGPNGTPVIFVVPTWSGAPEEGEARLAPFLRLGTLLAGAVDATPYGASLSWFDPYIVNGQHVFMETCSVPALDSRCIDALIEAMERSVSAGCAIFTHELKGAASRVPEGSTAFGLRRNHVLVEILAACADRSDKVQQQRHRRWTGTALKAFDGIALPGGYPNLLPRRYTERAADSYGNAERLIKAKRHYDPENIFSSAIPLPVTRNNDSRSTRMARMSG